MKPELFSPAIVSPAENPGHAILIDKGSFAGLSGGGSLAMVAVDLGPLFAGQIDYHHATGKIRWPRPVHVHHGPQAKWLKPNAPSFRRIHDEAAKVMLALAEAAMPTTISRHAAHTSMPARDWNHWAFLTAWCWSAWQDKERATGMITWEDRWQAMKALGYPSGLLAFQKIMKPFSENLPIKPEEGRKRKK